MDKRCNNCNHKHTGNHPHLCTECREALRKTGVKASNELPKGRVPWWQGRRESA